MGEQSKQSDIFRVIANQWKQMTPEQKKPFVDEVMLRFLCHPRLHVIMGVTKRSYKIITSSEEKWRRASTRQALLLEM